MRKKKLVLDELAVESFTPAAEPAERGTVHAHDSGPITDECYSCGVYTGCGGGCVSAYPCNGTLNSCPGYNTCAGDYTCSVASCGHGGCSRYVC